MISPSAATLRIVLGPNIPVEVPDTLTGSRPGMAAAGLTAESAVSCGCPLSIGQMWWAPRRSTLPTASLHHQTPAITISVSVSLSTNKHMHV